MDFSFSIMFFFVLCSALLCSVICILLFIGVIYICMCVCVWIYYIRICLNKYILDFAHYYYLELHIILVVDLVVDNEPHLHMLPICINDKNPKKHNDYVHIFILTNLVQCVLCSLVNVYSLRLFFLFVSGFINFFSLCVCVFVYVIYFFSLSHSLFLFQIYLSIISIFPIRCVSNNLCSTIGQLNTIFTARYITIASCLV